MRLTERSRELISETRGGAYRKDRSVMMYRWPRESYDEERSSAEMRLNRDEVMQIWK